MTEQPETIPQLIARWRERERKLCHRADTTPDFNSVYARSLAAQAERIAECADELEAAAPLRVQPSVFVSPDGEAHWRKMAEDEVNIFRFTNREVRLLFTEIDRLREAAAALRVPPDRQQDSIVKELTAVMGLLTMEINIWLAENHHLPQEEQVGYPPFHLLKIQKQIEARIAAFSSPAPAAETPHEPPDS